MWPIGSTRCNEPKKEENIMVQIAEAVQAPAEFVDIIRRNTEFIPTIRAVVIGAFFDHMKVGNRIGCYMPQQQTVYIDLGNLLQAQTLHSKGMMFIPNLWYTLLFALHHEIEHGLQLFQIPALAEYDKLPQEYEDAADKAAWQAIEEWAFHNEGHIPPLDKMGWLGKQLIVMLNSMYTSHPEIADEPEAYPFGAAAELEAVFALHEFTDRSKQILREEIDRGTYGVKVADRRYITAYEFFGL
jgi:hypothetical protein